MAMMPVTKPYNTFSIVCRNTIVSVNVIYVPSTFEFYLAQLTFKSSYILQGIIYSQRTMQII
jgi:hypothetical protein